jgi:hypothetical protein
MAISEGDRGWERARSRLLDRVEVAVREANRAVLRERIPELSETAFMRLAVTVARLRADYLAEALRFGHDRMGHVTPSEVERLAHARRAFDEAVAAFEALERAISRGYIDISEAALSHTPF